MKNTIKNLLLPMALVVLVSAGALKVNARIHTTLMEKTEQIAVTQVEYFGAEYYIEDGQWVLYKTVSDGTCSLDIGVSKCIKDIPGVGKRQMYGDNPIMGVRTELYHMDDN